MSEQTAGTQVQARVRLRAARLTVDSAGWPSHYSSVQGWPDRRLHPQQFLRMNRRSPATRKKFVMREHIMTEQSVSVPATAKARFR